MIITVLPMRTLLYQSQSPTTDNSSMVVDMGVRRILETTLKE